MASPNPVGSEGEGIYVPDGKAEFPRAVDNSPQLWSLCLTHADKFDRDLIESWKGDMDGILIFSGLFSAVAQVAIILARSTNQIDPVLPPMPTQNSQTAYLVINAFWFLSLAFSLTCAITATLVQQWSRTPFNPHQRARMRTYLHRGVQKFRFSELVGAIPMLLHVALFLFFCGLLVFLFNLDTTLARILLVFSIAALFLYVLLTALPVFFYDCPYKTPLTSVLSYITYAVASYRPRSRRRRGQSANNQWHPEKQTTHLTDLWAQDGSPQGFELDRTALRWTLLSVTDPNDLELFVGLLPGLLQSYSGTDFTRDGARAAQALLFGPDMLAKYLVGLLHSAVPLDSLALSPADRRQLDARAVTCLSSVSLLARACEGPTLSMPQLWPAWATAYSNPVARDALAFRAHPNSALAALALSVVLLLARRALIAYRAFLEDMHKRAATAASAPAMLYPSLASDVYARLSAGVYLARALGDVMHGLSGDPDSGIGGGAPLAQRAEELLGGALRPYIPGAAPRAPGAGAGGAGRVMNWELGALAKAAQEDMVKAKVCLAVLFMYAACALPADGAGQEALRTLATPVRWKERCEYDEKPNAAMGLLLAVRHAHGEGTLTVFDADEVVALYRTIHDPRSAQPEPFDADAIEDSVSNMLPRRTPWAQGTL
ncbi:hypothetical protein F5148DRAFT_1228629 [Russula earlei]|uniref:Uncharacterized protein n=1 Tax=Russula earlei TaxID=71964 RepID=A0ACC0TZG1_9AGAM|nr:hypothetical protein F5148DRAFT_1228629 [Russula earlei]